MGRINLVRKIATDTAWFVLFGLSIAVGMMISHEPGSDTFTLNWSTTKLFLGVLGGFITALMVGIIRWRMWVRSYPEALR